MKNFFFLSLFLGACLFSRSQQSRVQEVIIDEIFADPTPAVGLPGYEWIELKNISASEVKLEGWRIGDAVRKSGLFPELVLLPDSFLIVCSSGAFSSLQPFGNTIFVSSFPSLNNDHDTLTLYDAQGIPIYSVAYSSSWYGNDLKKPGGWSLEMIDTRNVCNVRDNWTASIDASGGTPGRKNSVDAVNEDTIPPRLLKAFFSGKAEITLVFSEPVNVEQAQQITNYQIDNGLEIAAAAAEGPLYDRVKISVSPAAAEGKIYTLSVSHITDCRDNLISPVEIRTALASEAKAFDVVINEILFNPKPDGVDYVEIYNRSDKVIDLSRLFIANRNAAQAVSNARQLASEPLLFFPQDYLVLTTDPDIVKKQFMAKDPGAFLQLASMPSFPDSRGYVLIVNSAGEVVDEVDYDAGWHFALLQNKEGVALERIDYNAPSVQNNFHSAAASAGFGTPGYKNSQFMTVQDAGGEIRVTPSVFSPDNDGRDDFLTIAYRFPIPGFVANISIFDASGRLVRNLQRNALSGIEGFYRWDGLNDKQQKLPQGIYIIYTEVFHPGGARKVFKNPVTLARRPY